MNKLVYFIRTIGADFVKIGIAEFPLYRCEMLQKANPHELVILRLEHGGRRREKQHHETFQDQRVRGEWFTLSGPIEEYLASPHTHTVLCTYPGCPLPAAHHGNTCDDHNLGPPPTLRELRRQKLARNRTPKPTPHVDLRCSAPDCSTEALTDEFCAAHRPSPVTTIMADPNDPRLQIRAVRPTDELPNPILHPGKIRHGLV